MSAKQFAFFGKLEFPYVSNLIEGIDKSNNWDDQKIFEMIKSGLLNEIENIQRLKRPRYERIHLPRKKLNRIH